MSNILFQAIHEDSYNVHSFNKSTPQYSWVSLDCVSIVSRQSIVNFHKKPENDDESPAYVTLKSGEIFVTRARYPVFMELYYPDSLRIAADARMRS